MKGAGASVLSTMTMTMKEHPTQAGRVRRDLNAAEMPRLLVDKLVIRANAEKTRQKGATKWPARMPIR